MRVERTNQGDFGNKVSPIRNAGYAATIESPSPRRDGLVGNGSTRAGGWPSGGWPSGAGSDRRGECPRCGGWPRHRRCTHQYCSGRSRIARSRHSLYHRVSDWTLSGQSDSLGSATPSTRRSNCNGQVARVLAITIIGAPLERVNSASALWQDAGCPRKSTQHPLGPPY